MRTTTKWVVKMIPFLKIYKCDRQKRRKEYCDTWFDSSLSHPVVIASLKELIRLHIGGGTNLFHWLLQ
jgi:hypothetical protein